MHPQTPLPDGTTLSGGQFTITSHLGAGGFGQTYTATDRFGRQTVIKECFPLHLGPQRGRDNRVLIPQATPAQDFDIFIKLFVREARLLAQLSHPNIIGVNTAFEENDTAYLVMDRVFGRDLDTILRTEHASLSPPQIIDIARQLLRAVGEVHRRSMLHRDIKPGNILLEDHSSRIVLIDFGTARMQLRSQGKTISPGALVSDGYSPSEFYPPIGHQGPESDLYSVAATLYALITGADPIDSKTRIERKTNEDRDPLTPLLGHYPDYPDAFLTCIDQALTLKFASRMHSADAWLKRIEPEELPPEDDVPDTRRIERTFAPEPKRRLWPVLVGASLGTVLGAVGVLIWKENNPEPTIAVLQQQRAKLDADLADSQRRLMAEQDTVSALSRDVGELRGSRDALQGEVERLQQVQTASQSQVTNLQQQLAMQSGVAEASSLTRDALQAQLQTSNTEVVDLRRTLVGLQAQVDTLTDARNGLERLLAVAEAERDTARADLADAETRIDQQQTELDDLNTQINTAFEEWAAEQRRRIAAEDLLRTLGATPPPQTAQRGGSASSQQADPSARLEQLIERAKNAASTENTTSWADRLKLSLAPWFGTPTTTLIVTRIDDTSPWSSYVEIDAKIQSVRGVSTSTLADFEKAMDKAASLELETVLVSVVDGFTEHRHFLPIP